MSLKLLIQRFHSNYSLFIRNNASPLLIQTIGPKNSPFHPSVLYFEKKWNGFEFWMAESPFPQVSVVPYRDRWECPCIHVSHDGINWHDLFGLKNPLSDLTEQEIESYDYLSDPHIFMRGDQMECWYRKSKRHGRIGYKNSQTEHQLYRKTTKDGIHWTDEELLIDITKHFGEEIVSPAILFQDGKYRMWAVMLSNEILKEYTVQVLESEDAREWSECKQCKLFGIEDTPWHIDVNYFDNKFQLLIYSRINSFPLSLWQSIDGVNFSKFKTLPLRTGIRGTFFDYSLYRSALCKISDRDYRVYFSAVDHYSSYIGLLKGPSLQEMTLFYKEGGKKRSVFFLLIYLFRERISYLLKLQK